MPTATAGAFRQALAEALVPLYGEREAASVASIVLEDAFGHKRQSAERPFSAAEQQAAQDISHRLLAGEPVQYVLGEADFYGLRFMVSPAVLIPRAETEELVALCLAQLPAPAPQRIIDIGTGSGCIPVALQRQRPHWEIHALDVSASALAVARANALRHGAAIEFHEADILEAEHWPALGQFTAIVSNPPYIPPQEAALMPAWVTAHEPHLALFVPAEDPLLFYRRILAFAQSALLPGGHVFFEVNEFNATAVLELVQSTTGFAWAAIEQDMSGRQRMVYGAVE